MKTIRLVILLLVVNSLMGQNFPQKISDDNQIIEHNGYTLSYNETCEQANWVRYVLKSSDVVEKTAKRKNYFKKDKLVGTGSASTSDYSNSGYDRGHLKPAADESADQEQMDETFIMSNVSPQDPSFNRGVWKRLENHTRKLVVSYDSIIVITGGILDDSLNRISGNICIPTNYFKILYLYKSGRLIKVESYLIPNSKSDRDITTFITTLSYIENKSKLKFK